MTTTDVKAWMVRHVPPLRGTVLMRTSLDQIGWTRSAREGLPVDREGRPVAWLTYPALHLLGTRVPADARVFEYGSGHSTLWWSSRVAEVVACEHDPRWAARIARRVPPNATVLSHPDRDEYVAALAEHGTFDVVVIDGVERARCAEAATDALTGRGVIVWDNSDREAHAAAMTDLEQLDFRHLQLWGLAPGFDHWGATSIFYRDGNCLGL
jgi:hypothetical protein